MSEQIKKRYFRKVISHPDGAIVHHGDCHFFSKRICTCGLLHDLVWIKDEDIQTLYPKFFEEIANQEQKMHELTFGRD